jgi:hypothetical protein
MYVILVYRDFRHLISTEKSFFHTTFHVYNDSVNSFNLKYETWKESIYKSTMLELIRVV